MRTILKHLSSSLIYSVLLLLLVSCSPDSLLGVEFNDGEPLGESSSSLLVIHKHSTTTMGDTIDRYQLTQISDDLSSVRSEHQFSETVIDVELQGNNCEHVVATEYSESDKMVFNLSDIDSLTQQQELLMMSDDREIGEFSLSDDGSRLAYTVKKQSSEQVSPNWLLFVYDFTVENEMQITETGSSRGLLWLDNKLLFSFQESLFSATMLTEYSVGTGVVTVIKQFHGSKIMAGSSDEMVYYSTNEVMSDIPISILKSLDINTMVTNVVYSNLPENPYLDPIYNAYSPALSPDGSLLAFIETTSHDQTFSAELCLLDIKTESLQCINTEIFGLGVVTSLAWCEGSENR